MGTSGAIGKIRSSLARPLDRKYPTNLAVMILVPAAALALVGLALWQQQSVPAALESAIRGALCTFGGWALAREIAPDDNPAAFVCMALVFLAALYFPDASVLPLFTALMLARIVNRSVGIPATLVDSAAVTLLAAWAAYATRQPGLLFVSAIGFGLDAALSPPLRRQWLFTALSAGAGLTLLLSGEAEPPATGGEDIALALPVLAMAAAYGLVILRTRKIRSVADVSGEPLSTRRVQAAMAVTSLMGIQGALTGVVAPTPSTLIWAVLAGLLLMSILRPRRTIFLPLFLLALPACTGSAVQSASPAVITVDTLMDVGGRRLHLKAWRNPSALTLVFESGGASSMDSWQNLPQAAAQEFSLRVVAYDRAGLGGSETGPIDLVPEQEMKDLALALDRLGAGRIVLVGHSYGALLSVFHAMLDPMRVVGLVLVDPMNTDFIRRVTLEWVRNTAPDIPAPASPRDTVIVRMKRTFDSLVARAEPGIGSLEIPIVVISAGMPWWGDAGRDTAWRASHETIGRMKPNRRLLIAAQSRHDIPATEPGIVIQAIRELLTLVGETR